MVPVPADHLLVPGSLYTSALPGMVWDYPTNAILYIENGVSNAKSTVARGIDRLNPVTGTNTLYASFTAATLTPSPSSRTIRRFTVSIKAATRSESTRAFTSPPQPLEPRRSWTGALPCTAPLSLNPANHSYKVYVTNGVGMAYTPMATLITVSRPTATAQSVSVAFNTAKAIILSGTNPQGPDAHLHSHQRPDQQVTLTVGSAVHIGYVFLTHEDNPLSGTPFHNDQAFMKVNRAIFTTIYQANQLSTAQLNNGFNTIFPSRRPAT